MIKDEEFNPNWNGTIPVIESPLIERKKNESLEDYLKRCRRERP